MALIHFIYIAPLHILQMHTVLLLNIHDPYYFIYIVSQAQNMEYFIEFVEPMGTYSLRGLWWAFLLGSTHLLSKALKCLMDNKFPCKDYSNDFFKSNYSPLPILLMTKSVSVLDVLKCCWNSEVFDCCWEVYHGTIQWPLHLGAPPDRKEGNWYSTGLF